MNVEARVRHAFHVFGSHDGLYLIGSRNLYRRGIKTIYHTADSCLAVSDPHHATTKLKEA